MASIVPHRYHLGSIAFGSLIIAIIQIIRVMLEYIDHKLGKYDNAFVKFILAYVNAASLDDS